MPILISVIIHNKNVQYLDRVLDSIKNLKGKFDLECYCFNTENKVIDYFENKDIKLLTYERPIFNKKNDGVEHYCGMEREELSQLVFLRNKILDRLLDTKCSHQLLVDSDVILKKETVERLLASKKDVVGGWYFNKRFPDIAVTMIFFNRYIGDCIKRKKLFKVITIGAGCLLLSRKVIESKNRFPYKTLRGEDWDFSQNLIKKGYEIYCDSYLYCEHLGKFRKEAKAYKNKKIKEWNL